MKISRMTPSLVPAEKHRKLSDEAFESSFAARSLQASFFTHEAHLRLAYIHLQRYGLEQAIANMRGQIRSYAESLGAHTKYNDTVTVAAMLILHDYAERSTASDFYGLLAEFPELKSNFQGLLSQHYSMDVFRNPDAKKAFQAPDLLPFSGKWDGQ